jgi:hypothetical protein
MAGALVITCGLTTLDVEHGVSRDCPFTLRSQALGELRVQLRIFALDATAQGWLAIVAEDTIEMSPGETRQVSVSVTPQASGRFAFRLDAIPVAAAVERTIGPSVDLVVASRRALTLPRRGLPWLAVGLAVLALVLLALAIAWMLDRRMAAHAACAPSRGGCAPAMRLSAGQPGRWRWPPC